MVSRACFGNIISPCSLLYKSLDFSINEYSNNILRNWKKNAKEFKWYTYKTTCVSWLPILLDSLNCYKMNARTMYNDNAVYNLILYFTIIHKKVLEIRDKSRNNEVDIPIKSCITKLPIYPNS